MRYLSLLDFEVYGIIIFFLLCVVCICFLYRSKKTLFEPSLWKAAKMILNFSFWVCALLCLLTFEKQTKCASCFQSFLSRSLNNIYDASVLGIVKENVRFIASFVLSVIWIIFALVYERHNKCRHS